MDGENVPDSIINNLTVPTVSGFTTSQNQIEPIIFNDTLKVFSGNDTPNANLVNNSNKIAIYDSTKGNFINIFSDNGTLKYNDYSILDSNNVISELNSNIDDFELNVDVDTNSLNYLNISNLKILGNDFDDVSSTTYKIYVTINDANSVNAGVEANSISIGNIAIIGINSLTKGLSLNDTITFFNGAQFTLTADAGIGSTTITGQLTINTIATGQIGTIDKQEPVPPIPQNTPYLNFTSESGDLGFGLRYFGGQVQYKNVTSNDWTNISASFLDIKLSCVLATTSDLSVLLGINVNYGNGTDGVGATLTRTGNGVFPNIDGETLTQNQRILVKDQNNRGENGIYQLSTVGDETTPWVLTRASDADTPEKLNAGAFTVVERGIVNRGNSFTFLPINAGDVVIGATQFDVSLIGSSNAITQVNFPNETVPSNNRLLTVSNQSTTIMDAESNLTFDGTNLVVNGNLKSKFLLNSDFVSINGANTTYTIENLKTGLIRRDCNDNIDKSDNLPTPSDIVSGIPNVAVGNSFEFVVENISITAGNVTLLANGNSLSGDMEINKGLSKKFLVVITNIETPAVSIHQLGGGSDNVVDINQEANNLLYSNNQPIMDTSIIWQQIGSSILGEANDQSGSSVSSSADGMIVAIGSPNHNSNQGTVRVFKRDLNTAIGWSQFGGDIDGEAGDQSGFSISLSADGKFIAIGSPGHDTDTTNPLLSRGTVRIYQLDIGQIFGPLTALNWTQVGDDIDGETNQDKSGSSVSLSADGMIVAIGAPMHELDINNPASLGPGTTRIYQRDTDPTNSVGWKKIGSNILATFNDKSGTSVSLSADGRIVAIGSPGHESDINGPVSLLLGTVRIYQSDTNLSSWKQLGNDIDGESGDGSGQSVSLSANGTIVAIGSSEANSGKGIVRIYERDTDPNNSLGWKQLNSNIENGLGSYVIGRSISLSADGMIVAVAYTPSGNSNVIGLPGFVRIFKRDTTSTNWIQIGDNIDIDNFPMKGLSLSLSANGKIIVIGSGRNDINTNGEVIIYNLADEFLNLAVNNSIILKEKVNASPDVDTYGQLWVKFNGQNVPNELYFTTGDGNDIQITSGNSLNATGTLNQLTDVKFGGTDFGGTTEPSLFIGTNAPGTAPSHGNLNNAQNNLAILKDALDSITTGYQNIAIGKEALTSTTSGIDNISLGYKSGHGNVTGNDNIFIGSSSAYNNNGNYNVLVGGGSVGNNMTGCNNNVLIGYASDVSSSSADNQIVIGYSTTGIGDNSVTLGNADVTDVYCGQNQTASIHTNYVHANRIVEDLKFNNYTISNKIQSNNDSTNNYSTGGWMQIGLDLNGDTTDDSFGKATSISADGNIIAIGDPERTTYTGRVVIYERNFTNLNGWTLLGSPLDGGSINDYYGSSVSFSSDGKIIAIGAYGFGTDGKVEIRQYNGSSWVQLGANILGDVSSNQQIGIGNTDTISLSNDGNIICIGHPYFNTENSVPNIGRVKVFEYRTVSTNEWNSQTTFIATNSQTNVNSNGSSSGRGGEVYNSSTKYWIQLGNNIDGSRLDMKLGFSVKLSGDGTTFIAGGPDYDLSINLQGIVAVYRLINNTWTQLGGYFYGTSEKDVLGRKVEISKNGNIVAIAAPHDDINNIGYIRIFQYDSSKTSSNSDSNSSTFGPIGWSRLGSDIVGETNDNLGDSLSLSVDGTIVAVSARAHTVNNIGVVRVYQYNSGNWVQIGKSIKGESTNDNIGDSISLSANGKMLVIGATQKTNNGTVSIYHLNNSFKNINVEGSISLIEKASSDSNTDTDGTTISNKGQLWVKTATPNELYFTNDAGNDIRLTSGSSIAADNNNNSNEVHNLLYSNNEPIHNTGINWEKIGPDIQGTSNSQRLGSSLALNSNGTIVAAGVIVYSDGGINDIGKVIIHNYYNNTWNQMGNLIVGTTTDDRIGTSAISLSSDGTTIAINGGLDPSYSFADNKGFIRVYKYNDNTDVWDKIGNDINGDANKDFFGISLSLSSNGNILAVGVPEGCIDENILQAGKSGRVEVYENVSNDYSSNQLGSNIVSGSSPSANEYDFFGESVSLNANGDILAVGIPGHDGGGNSRGAVNIYQYSNNSWTQLGSTLLGNSSLDKLGMSVSLNATGTIVACGVPGNSPGKVNVYKYTNDWAILGSSISGSGVSNFGKSVSLNAEGNIFAVGQPGSTSDNGNSSVYKYFYNDWEQIGSTITGDSSSDNMGSTISISSDGKTFAVAAIDNDDAFVDGGHIKVYNLPDEFNNLTIEGTVSIKEQSSAPDHKTAYGKIWIKDSNPNELYFTNDSGNDIQITSGAGLNASSAISTVTNASDNRVATFSGSNSLNGETNLIFDGTNLGIGVASPSQQLEVSNKIKSKGMISNIPLSTNINSAGNQTINFLTSGNLNFTMSNGPFTKNFSSPTTSGSLQGQSGQIFIKNDATNPSTITWSVSVGWCFESDSGGNIIVPNITGVANAIDVFNYIILEDSTTPADRRILITKASHFQHYT